MSTLKVAFPAGIGDTLWLMTKMQSLLKIEGRDKLAITICQDSLRRSEDFLRSFSFVESVNYCDWNILQHQITLPNGSYNYGESQRNWHNQFDWFLQVNGHLENGNKLGSWYSDWEINWNVMDEYQFAKCDVDYATELKNRIGKYCVFYYGPESGNTICGHNRGPIWTPQDWKILGESFQSLGLKIISVGAKWDDSYMTNYIDLTRLDTIDLVGITSISKTLSILKQSEFVIGYQSGIVISCPFMDIRAGGFWRPYGNSISPDHFISFNENMASSWVNPKVLERGDWMPLIYGKDTPESIYNYVKEKWL